MGIIQDIYNSTMGRIGVITNDREVELLKTLVENNGHIDGVFSNDREMNAFFSRNEMDELHREYKVSTHPDQRFDIHQEFFAHATKSLTEKDESIMVDMWNIDQAKFIETNSLNDGQIENLIYKYRNTPAITEEQIGILLNKNLSGTELFESGIVKDLLNTNYAKENNISLDLRDIDPAQVKELHILISQEKIGSMEYFINRTTEEINSLEKDLYATHQDDILLNPDLDVESIIKGKRSELENELNQLKDKLNEEQLTQRDLSIKLESKELIKDWKTDLSELEDIKMLGDGRAEELVDKYKIFPEITEKQIKIISQNLHPEGIVASGLLADILHTKYAEVNKVSTNIKEVPEKVTDLHLLVVKCKIAEIEHYLYNENEFYKLIGSEMRIAEREDIEAGIEQDPDHYTDCYNDMRSKTDKSINTLEKQLEDNEKLLQKCQEKKDIKTVTEIIKDVDKNPNPYMGKEAHSINAEKALVNEKKLNIILQKYGNSKEIEKFIPALKQTDAQTLIHVGIADKLNKLPYVINTPLDITNINTPFQALLGEIEKLNLASEIEDLKDDLLGMRAEMETDLSFNTKDLERMKKHNVNLERKIGEKELIYSNLETSLSKYNNSQIKQHTTSKNVEKHEKTRSPGASKEIAASGSKSLIADSGQNGNVEKYRIKDASTNTISDLDTKDIDFGQQKKDSLEKLLSGGKAELKDLQGTTNLFNLKSGPAGWTLQMGKQLFSSMDAESGM